MSNQAIFPGPADFLAELSAFTGFTFTPGPAGVMEDKPLYVGDVIYDLAAGLHCVVLNENQAVRAGYISWRKSNCWRPAQAAGAQLTITNTAKSKEAVCAALQTADQEVLEVLWWAKTMAKRAAPVAPPAAMTAENFCYWLQGRTELVDAAPSAQEWATIQEHLALVFDKRTGLSPSHNAANAAADLPKSLLVC